MQKTRQKTRQTYFLTIVNYRFRGQLSLALCTLLASLGLSIANVALPTLSEVFALEMQTVQWVAIAYLIAITVSVVNIGKLADMIGRKRMLLYGIGLFLLSSIGCAMTTSFAVLLIARGFQGIGAAALIGLPMATVQEITPSEKTGAAMGLLGSTSAVGTMLGPTLGGFIISVAGWPFIFWLFVPLGLVCFLLINQTLPGTKANHGFQWGKVAWGSTGLLVTSLLAYTFSFTSSGSNNNVTKYGSLIVALLAFTALIYHEKRAQYPLLSIKLFLNKQLSSGLLMNAAVATVMMSTLIVGPFYLTYAMAFDEDLVGLILSIGPLVSTFSGVVAGKVVDRRGASFVVMLGLGVMVLATLFLALLPTFIGLTGYILSIVLLTPGYQLFLAANNTEVMTAASHQAKGLISGILNLSRNLGLITGASLMGVIFMKAVGTSNLTCASEDSILFGMKITYLFASTLLLCAVFLALFKTSKTEKV